MNFKQWREDAAKKGLSIDLADLLDELSIPWPEKYSGDCKEVLNSVGYIKKTWPTGWSWLRNITFEIGQSASRKAPTISLRDEIEEAARNAAEQVIRSRISDSMLRFTPIEHR